MKLAELSHPGTGLKLEVESTEPCMLLYGKHRAFCCETHCWPNGPNIPNSPGSITRAGEPFRSIKVIMFVSF